jgi:hypothetical protein
MMHRAKPSLRPTSLCTHVQTARGIAAPSVHRQSPVATYHCAMTDATGEATSTAASEIVLETINPEDMTPEELQELADALSPRLENIDVQVAYETQYGSGVTWHEVLHVWLPSAEFLKGVGYTLVIEETVKWMRGRFDRRGGGKRPKSIIVHGPDGEEIVTVVLDNSEADPREEASQRTVRRLKPRKRFNGK